MIHSFIPQVLLSKNPTFNFFRFLADFKDIFLTLKPIALTLLSGINLRNYIYNLCFERWVLHYQHPMILLSSIGELLFCSSNDYFGHINVLISLYHEWTFESSLTYLLIFMIAYEPINTPIVHSTSPLLSPYIFFQLYFY